MSTIRTCRRLCCDFFSLCSPQLISFSSGYMAWSVLGLSLALFLPWVGVCLFISHSSGFLGGYRYQKYDVNRDMKRKELSCAVAFFTILLWYVSGFGSSLHWNVFSSFICLCIVECNFFCFKNSVAYSDRNNSG